MGTREVYEEKLRRGNLDYDTTMNPGLGSARCPRCLSLLNPNPEKGEWTITSVLHDAAAVPGSGIGGLLSAVHAFNTGIPDLQNRFPGSKRLSFLVGVPLLLGYSGVGAAFGGNMIFFAPELFDLVTIFDQLTVTSYYASSSASHYGISMLTRHIEEYYLSRTLKE
ncbi:PREDICTED: uncharacterized protein LOC106341565 [Brassica oleracea var. oleracea]|uniref:uncharacterized protein LOC106341565 n=1 Tax=Brassica oleracea var. oleracea TaxID=109376 RepID=UPI0006A6AD2E|nr:PREDICTED: uncharacterized protein LOC106341565 [Brassica oleracea var. oleracea]